MTSKLFSHSIVEVLKTFSNEEIQDFKLFLDSPYFNRQIVIQKLYAELIRFYPDFNHKKFTEENLISFISPNKKKTTLFDALSILVNKIQTFLSINHFIADDFNFNRSLLGVLKQRDLMLLYEKNLKLAITKISEANLPADDCFRNEYKLNRLSLEFLASTQGINNQINVKKGLNYLDSSLLNLVTSFVLSLISQFLDYKFLSINHDLDYKNNEVYKFFSLLKISSLIDELKKFEDRKYLFESYSALLDMFSDIESSAKYKRYKKLVEKNLCNFKTNELSFHYSCLIYYFTLKLNRNQNDKKGIEELFNLYIIFTEKKLYRNEFTLHISKSLFRNIFLFFINNKKYDYAKNFIDNFINELDLGQRKNMMNYCLAYYYYVSGRFEESTECLLKIQLDLFGYKFDVKNLLLKNYYELGAKYTEDAYYLLETYRQFLTVNRMVSRSFKKTYEDFLNYYEKILSYRSGKEMIDLGYLKKDIEADELLFSRGWMLRKIAELEGAKKKRKKKVV